VSPDPRRAALTLTGRLDVADVGSARLELFVHGGVPLFIDARLTRVAENGVWRLEGHVSTAGVRTGVTVAVSDHGTFRHGGREIAWWTLRAEWPRRRRRVAPSQRGATGPIGAASRSP
jgi:hypothetical protein